MKGKMMRTTFKTLLAAACITVAATGIAVAEHGNHGAKSGHCAKEHHGKRHHAGGPELGHPRYLHGIALTNEQEDKIFALNYAEVPKLREQKKQRYVLHQELREVSHAAQFDENKAKLIADKLATLEKDDALNRARTESKVLAVLTSEQREQALKNKAQFGKHRGEHHPTGFRGHPKQVLDVKN